MVPETVIRKHARRLLRLPFAPGDDDEKRGVLEEFRRVLQARVLTEAHCEAIINDLMAHAQRCPPPAEVIEAAERVEAPDAVKAPMGCKECHGTGFRRYSKRVHVAGVADYEADFADFCGCALGEFKRAAEAREKAEREAKSRR